jgi:hypothetical protein
MWNVKTRVIPGIIGATGTISKSFRNYVSTIPGNRKDLNSAIKLQIYKSIIRPVVTYGCET